MDNRIITFENQNKNLIINQNLDIGYAGSVWDASLVLTYFFKKQNDLYNNIINFKLVKSFFLLIIKIKQFFFQKIKLF